MSTCIPSSDLATRMLDLRVRHEDLGGLEKLILPIGSTLLYPIVAAISLIAFAYFAVCEWWENRKVDALCGRMEEIQQLSNEQIQSLASTRKAKLQGKIAPLKNEAVEPLIKWDPNLRGEMPRDLESRLSKAYQEAKRNAEADDYSFSSAGVQVRIDGAFGAFLKWKRARLEEAALSSTDEASLKAHFFDRAQAAKARHECYAKVYQHYKVNMLTTLIPIVGLMKLFDSPQTTDRVLIESGLVDCYSTAVSKHEWIKPY